MRIQHGRKHLLQHTGAEVETIMVVMVGKKIVGEVDGCQCKCAAYCRYRRVFAGSPAHVRQPSIDDLAMKLMDVRIACARCSCFVDFSSLYFNFF